VESGEVGARRLGPANCVLLGTGEGRARERSEDDDENEDDYERGAGRGEREGWASSTFGGRTTLAEAAAIIRW